jgi:hypothetical protein
MMERTFTFTNETISVENLDDGSHIVKVGPDGTRILAYIEDGKVARYAAEDSTGNRKRVLSISQESSDSVEPIIPGETAGIACMICYSDESAGAVVCYGAVECPPFIGPEKMGPH